MRRFQNLDPVLDAIVISKISPKDFIPLVEDIINMETSSLEANVLINDEVKILKHQINISRADLLLSLLRMRDTMHDSIP